ncbi:MULTISPECIES: PA3371 family protein [Pseudomonas]|uniref:PA3371 family protein n=1 Tax=Pseudomonas TaxID=286 RepID=UPI0008F1AA15|nr:MULTISPECIES: PA3371 family protein [Pseudomonas]MAB98339.1 hypothetical protein [Pseudomonadaceae bacterium]NRH27459.1 hypothetical protein [Pseudomonas sp. MS19]SFT98169.1 hypothetical protein SAMN05216264_107210 [Pseudomonas marincola]
MSKAGLGLLILSVVLGAVLATDAITGVSSSAVIKGLFGLTLGASIVALALGRRIKFDPVLR